VLSFAERGWYDAVIEGDERMATTLATPGQKLLTADEFFERYGDEHNTDLVDGIVVRYPVPGTKHGFVGAKLNRIVGRYLDDHDTGRLFNNDTCIRVKSNPDRVRGADFAYQSCVRFSRDAELPDGIMTVMPELVAEVKSPSDSWPEVMIKVNDYLEAGVNVVLVLDPAKQSVSIHRPNADAETIPTEGTLTIPDLFPGFECPVQKLFL
jgi:Uma2 family endonuclease